MTRTRKLIISAIACGALATLALVVAQREPEAHGGGLNACGCHFNRKTGTCHCHHDRGCGCSCEPDRCASK